MEDRSFEWLFWNREEGRLRAGVRVYLQWILRAVVFALVGVPLALFLLGVLVDGAAGRDDLRTTADSLEVRFATIVAALVCGSASVWLGGRFVDHRPFRGFGFRLDREWWLDCAFGFVLGGALMGGIFAVELGTGWTEVSGTFEGGWGSPFAVFGPVIVFVSAGVWEELFYRGYMITNLAEGLNLEPYGARGAVLLAWVGISTVFGMSHLGNPGASVLAAVNIGAAGLMLGLPYVLTGELGLPIGLHVGWNLFQSTVFGLPVSGIQPDGATVFSVDRAGPALLMGGGFGPEGGLLGLAAIAVGCVLILGWAQLRGTLRVSEKVARPPVRAGSGGHASPSS